MKAYETPPDAVTCLACKGEGIDEEGEYCEACGGHGWVN